MRTLFARNGLRARLGWYAPGQRMARHAHGQHQFSLLLGGTLAESVAADDIRLAGCALGFKAAGVDHANDYGPSGALIFGIDLDATLHARREVAPPTDWRWRGAPSSELLARSRSLLDDLVAGVDADAEGRLWELLGAFGAAGDSAAGPPPSWVARASARLQEEATPLAEVARDEGLHPVYFARAFTRWTGSAPSTLRARARLQRAVAAVSSGQSLVDAALNAGFADQAHFSRSARAHYGLSPRQLRNLFG